jgi:hypothetical protein
MGIHAVMRKRTADPVFLTPAPPATAEKNDFKKG